MNTFYRVEPSEKTLLFKYLFRGAKKFQNSNLVHLCDWKYSNLNSDVTRLVFGAPLPRGVGGYGIPPNKRGVRRPTPGNVLNLGA